MKKLLTLISAISFTTFFPLNTNATVTLTLHVKNLLDNNSSLLLDNSLIQLITRDVTTNAFSTPTTTAFIESGEAIVTSFALQSNTAEAPGSFLRTFSFSFSSGIAANQELLLRWWPTLTTANTTPLANAYYGQYNTTLIADNSDITWLIPSDGTTAVNLNFYANATTGKASLQVIPEPSTYALAGIAGLIAVAAIRRRKKS